MASTVTTTVEKNCTAQRQKQHDALSVMCQSSIEGVYCWVSCADLNLRNQTMHNGLLQLLKSIVVVSTDRQTGNYISSLLHL
jgi:hypothetical protein